MAIRRSAVKWDIGFSSVKIDSQQVLPLGKKISSLITGQMACAAMLVATRLLRVSYPSPDTTA
jgi:hypothetical protein